MSNESKRPNPKSHTRTALQLLSAEAEIETLKKSVSQLENDRNELRQALKWALEALERVRPQVCDAIPAGDVELAIRIGRKLVTAEHR